MKKIKVLLGSTGSGKTTKLRELFKGKNYLYIGFFPLDQEEEIIELAEPWDVTIDKKELNKPIQILIEPTIIDDFENKIQIINLENTDIIIDELRLLLTIKDYMDLLKSSNTIYLSIQTFAQVRYIDQKLYNFLLLANKEIILFRTVGLSMEDYHQIFYSLEFDQQMRSIEVGTPKSTNIKVSLTDAMKDGILTMLGLKPKN